MSNVGGPAFAPIVVESLGDRDDEVLATGYGDARSQGIRGTLLPPAVPGGAGGSAGFNASDPMPIIVDPDIPGASYVIQPGALKGKDGTPRRAAAGGFDRADVRRVAANEMRRVAGPEAAARKEEPVAKKRVARKKESAPESVPIAEERVAKQAALAEELASELPTKLVAFDFGPPMGTLEVRYHDVFQEGNRLVLAWDTGCLNASKYTPAKMDQPLRVIVGREREEYRVFSLGLEFTDVVTGRFYILLLIDTSADE